MTVYQGQVVQSMGSITSSLRVVSVTVLAESISNILIFLAEKILKFFQQKNQHIRVSREINFNKSLTNDVFSFEQLGLGFIISNVSKIQVTQLIYNHIKAFTSIWRIRMT